MPRPTPLHCRAAAFDTLADELDGLDTTRGLVRCATAVAMHRLTDADPDRVEADLQTLTQSISDRLRSDDPRAVLAHAHAVLFDEARFRGNAEDYYDPRNSYLPAVLTRHLGLPITLTLVYKAVLERLGLRVVGVNAPGHFLAGVVGQTPEGGASAGRPGVAMVVDPFHGGRVLNRAEAFRLIEQATGGGMPDEESLLHPATHTQWLVRIIQNLAACFDRLGQTDDLHAMLEMRALVETCG